MFSFIWKRKLLDKTNGPLCRQCVFRMRANSSGDKETLAQKINKYYFCVDDLIPLPIIITVTIFYVSGLLEEPQEK